MSSATSTAISGVSSGIDWRSTVDSLMQIERQRVTTLEQNQESTREQVAAWNDLSDRFGSLQQQLRSFSDLDSFLTKAASSSDSDVVAANADTDAVTGSYSIEVDQLATASNLIHSGFADLNTTAVNSSGSSQQFVYTYGVGAEMETVSIDVADGSTLSELKDLINRDANNPGIRASIINDGSGSATAYHLVLTSDDTGSETAIAIDDGATTLGDGSSFDSAAFPDGSVGVNARIRVNGYPTADWIESQSNTVENVVEGVSFTLKTLTAGTPVEVTVNQDEATVRQKIVGFVGSYNAIMEKIDELGAYNAETETRGLLFGSAAMQQMRRNLQNLTNRTLAGIPDGNAYSSMGEIGLKTGDKGMIAIDEEKLEAALEDNFEDVGELFAFTTSSTSNVIQYFESEEYTDGGSVEVSVTYGVDGSISSATINGESAVIDNNFVLAPEDSDFRGLRLLFNDPDDGGGTVNATINLSQGISGSFLKRLESITNSDTGSLQYQTGALEESIERLQSAIEDQEDRLEQIRAKYEREFIAMEMAISSYQSQGNFLSSQLGGL